MIQRNFRKRLLALLCVSLAFGSVAQADQIFFAIKGKLGDFIGESTAPGGKRLTEAISMTQGVSVQGRRQYTPVTLTKYAGPASLQIWQALISQEALSEVTIDLVRPDEKGIPRAYQTVRLRGARVISFNRKAESGAPGKPAAIDEFSLQVSSIEISDPVNNLVVADQLDPLR